MPVEPIDPVTDTRIVHKTAVLNGYTYHYLYAAPKNGQYTHTVFLVSGSFLLAIWLYPTLELISVIFERFSRWE
jgi:soluble epoxide hydrolase / lipid-phosphate phosphatase